MCQRMSCLLGGKKSMNHNSITSNAHQLALTGFLFCCCPRCVVESSMLTSNTSFPSTTRVVVSGLCGRQNQRNHRKQGNTMGELACTASHMLAIRRAIDENPTRYFLTSSSLDKCDPSMYLTSSCLANSDYAIISEDDIMFPFDLDYDAMIALAPNDWGILQLVNSNPWSMKNAWHRYLRVLYLLQST